MESNNLGALCSEVCRVARIAGAYIAHERETFGPEKIEYKGTQNLVSYVDKTAEKMIIEQLSLLVPASRFVAEESTVEIDPLSYAKGDVWIIDPLDGTTNFTHGLPPYAVSIALMRDARVVVGVVYEISANECFYAYKGGGCLLNGRRVEVSSIDSIEKGLVITGLAYRTEDTIEAFRRSFDYFNLNSNGARRLGSAATDLAYVAAGRAECFYQKNLAPWDVAAGALLVSEAGGVVTDYNGGDDHLFGGEIIATNRVAHNVFYDKLKELL